MRKIIIQNRQDKNLVLREGGVSYYLSGDGEVLSGGSPSYYCDLNASGTGHVGSTGDPWSFVDWQTYVISGVLANIYLKGSIVTPSVKFGGTGATFMEYFPWDPTTNGPWRIQAADLTNANLTDTIIRGGILFLINGSTPVDVTIPTNREFAMFCMYFKCGNFNAPISAEGCLISTLIFHPLMRDILDSQVFNSCIAASSFQNGPALIHNCALNGNATFTEEIDCQTNWVPPILPAFNASKSSFLSTVLDAGITTPPQPGQTYNLSPTGLWGEARTGISAAYFGSTYPPEITSQPSDSTKIVGQTASFSVTANANPSPTSYVWRLNVTPLVNGGRISGVDTTALTITSLISGDAGNYSIIIANGISPDTTSNDATLVVNPIPPAVNTFIPFPARDGTQVISTINAATLMPMLSEDSIYFATINDVYKVYLYFTDQDGRQLKRIIHDGTALSGPAIWTSVAKAGIWQLEKIKVFDREGALHSFGRDNSSSDFTLV